MHNLCRICVLPIFFLSNQELAVYTKSIFLNFVKKLPSCRREVWSTDAILWFITPSLCHAMMIKSKKMCFWWLGLLMLLHS